MDPHEEKESRNSDLQSADEQPRGSDEDHDSQSDDPLQRELKAKADENQALQDKLLRLAAEFDNYKRLTQREQREQAKFANENLLKELLPTLDNLERALGHAKEMVGVTPLVEGVQLTLKQFLETLMKFGLRSISSLGQRFDPALHQAVAHVPAPAQAPNTVVEEYQKGYLLHDRVVRAAMVAVAAPSESGQTDSGQSD